MAKAANTTGLSGTERAAILLLAIGEEDASQVMKFMGPKEVQTVSSTMASLKDINKDQVGVVLDSFQENVGTQTALGIGTENYLRNVLTKALGPDKATSMIGRILMGGQTSGLEELKWMDPRSVAEVVRLEHPQIIAIVLSYLEADQSAQVLSVFPEKSRLDILMRIASLEGVQPSALKELNQAMEKQFAGKAAGSLQSSGIGGVKTAASIMNELESSIEAPLMENFKDTDSGLAEQVEELMFVFENLLDVDDRGIQILLREVQSDSLVVALKGASQTLKELIFKNMSKRAAEMMRDDLEMRGPVKLSDVEAAQKEIVQLARRLSDSGEIALGGTAGEEYV
ncbi:MAG: flagellar motor switch protein FliG [Gammaproteobacteria bacterium]|nr:flagellar motor switch protein FliG [Gammaproteobacteria bacterium]